MQLVCQIMKNGSKMWKKKRENFKFSYLFSQIFLIWLNFLTWPWKTMFHFLSFTCKYQNVSNSVKFQQWCILIWAMSFIIKHPVSSIALFQKYSQKRTSTQFVSINLFRFNFLSLKNKEYQIESKSIQLKSFKISF